jgi:hypothetical protein
LAAATRALLFICEVASETVVGTFFPLTILQLLSCMNIIEVSFDKSLLSADRTLIGGWLHFLQSPFTFLLQSLLPNLSPAHLKLFAAIPAHLLS